MNIIPLVAQYISSVQLKMQTGISLVLKHYLKKLVFGDKTSENKYNRYVQYEKTPMLCHYLC